MTYPTKTGAFIKSHCLNRTATTGWWQIVVLCGLSLAIVFILPFTLSLATAQAQVEQASAANRPNVNLSGMSTESFQVADGFQADLIYQVPREYGSWVSLTTSPSGLIASDQYGKLYRIQTGETQDQTRVQALAVDVGHAQGLLWAFDSLYVMSHGKKDQPPGLYRVQDTDSDGELDTATLLRMIRGGGEHGPHAIILSPDKKSLYVCAGNHTPLTEIQTSRVPRNWQEDFLLDRMWDPGGHAVGKLAPGGWICKTDPQGKQWELVSIGYRNQYDIAFDTNGELFTYDADMEWDIGTPWYRPTRVCHVTSGSEFGWRGGDAKWPTYYPDSVPPVIDIGPGSPTGIVFGTGARYPDRYQKALFIADWSFGFIYAIHLTADGGTWSGQKELFCSAPALQVTDMVVHDGDLFFTIGGRRTQSALYRIRYKQRQQTRPARSESLTELQQLRRQVEAADVNPLEHWKFLGHDDRSIRYAARLHLEKAALGDWIDRLKTETNVDAILQALVALCRHTDSNSSSLQLLQKTIQEKLDWSTLDEDQRLQLARVIGLSLIRLANVDSRPVANQFFRSLLESHYPTDSVRLNRELCRILVACESDQVVPKTIALIDSAGTQEEQISYVMSLRKVSVGWTPDLKKRYLQWFIQSAVFQGGKSFAGYLKNARDEFVMTFTAAERQEFASVLAVEMEEQDPYAQLFSRPVVKNWKVQDLLQKIEKANFDDRDLENGKRVFVNAQCYKCHQFAGSGGIVGPDLTALSRRYTTAYLLETLLEPSKEISSQYQATRFELEDGRLITGRVANLSRDIYMVQEDMITPGKLTNINRNDIVSSSPSKISPMPAGLLDRFSEQDILDLLAYLRSQKQ